MSWPLSSAWRDRMRHPTPVALRAVRELVAEAETHRADEWRRMLVELIAERLRLIEHTDARPDAPTVDDES